MVYRHIEESLFLIGMQVHRNQSVYPGHTQHIRHELRTDGHTGFVLTVLPCPTEVGDDGNDTFSRSTFGRIDHQQEFH